MEKDMPSGGAPDLRVNRLIELVDEAAVAVCIIISANQYQYQPVRDIQWKEKWLKIKSPEDPRVAIGNAERVRFYCLFPRTGFTPLLLRFLQTEQRTETRRLVKSYWVQVLGWGSLELVADYPELKINKCSYVLKPVRGASPQRLINTSLSLSSDFMFLRWPNRYRIRLFRKRFHKSSVFTQRFWFCEILAMNT